MRLLGRPARVAGGACHCAACGSDLGAFVADYRGAPAARLLGMGALSINPRLYGGAARRFCPVCLEGERTRLLLDRLAREGWFAPGTPRHAVLVCSGGPALLARLAHHDVTSANLAPTLFADTACDLRRAPFADGTFDHVLCAYVLTYIDDDAAAIAEIRRILRPGGVAWIVVPQDLALAATEEARHLPPEARRAQLGDACHMRLYGMDFDQVLTRAGFAVETLVPRALYDPATIDRLGLQPEDRLYRCTRP